MKYHIVILSVFLTLSVYSQDIGNERDEFVSSEYNRNQSSDSIDPYTIDLTELEATPEEMDSIYKSEQWKRFLFPYSDRNSEVSLGGGAYYLLELSLNYWFIIFLVFSCIGILISLTERENYSSLLESIKTFFRSMILFPLIFLLSLVFISFASGLVLRLFLGVGTVVYDEIITLDVCECEQKRKDRELYDYQLKQCQNDFGDSYFWEILCCLDKPHYCK